jgi:hypothetical protein
VIGAMLRCFIHTLSLGAGLSASFVGIANKLTDQINAF